MCRSCQQLLSTNTFFLHLQPLCSFRIPMGNHSEAMHALVTCRTVFLLLTKRTPIHTSSCIPTFLFFPCSEWLSITNGRPARMAISSPLSRSPPHAASSVKQHGPKNKAEKATNECRCPHKVAIDCVARRTRGSCSTPPPTLQLSLLHDTLPFAMNSFLSAMVTAAAVRHGVCVCVGGGGG